MNRTRRFTLVANRDIPELRLMAGDIITVDRRHKVAPVTYGGMSLMAPDYLSLLSRAAFHSRRGLGPYAADKAGPPLTVTPSAWGAQRTLENLHAELMGWQSSAKRRAEERREIRTALRSALAAPRAAAPSEQHASALLGTEGFHRLARSLAHLRREVI